MGYGGPIGLIVIGLVLALAFNEQQVGPLEVITLGWILVVAGIAWLLTTHLQRSTAASRPGSWRPGDDAS